MKVKLHNHSKKTNYDNQIQEKMLTKNFPFDNLNSILTINEL